LRGDIGRRLPAVCLTARRVPLEDLGCDINGGDQLGWSVESGCLSAGRDRTTLVDGLAGPGLRAELRLGDRRWRPAEMLDLPAGWAEPGRSAWVAVIRPTRRCEASARCGRTAA
jgi:hypothetical protein